MLVLMLINLCVHTYLHLKYRLICPYVVTIPIGMGQTEICYPKSCGNSDESIRAQVNEVLLYLKVNILVILDYTYMNVYIYIYIYIYI